MEIETKAVHSGYSPDPTTNAVAVPIYLPGDRYFGAMAFHAPTVRVSLMAAELHLPVLKEGVSKLLNVLFD